MNMTRRSLTVAGVALAATVAMTASPPARASNASDAAELVAKAQATIGEFGRNKDFPTFSPALAKARGVLIFPQVLKAGFVLGGSGGSGVLLVRDAKTGKWIGPAFYTMGSASLGFQAGASAAEVVMIVNSQKALDSDFVAYSAVKGAFAGLAIDGSVLDARGGLNSAYYGKKKTTPIDILVKRQVANKPESAALQAAVKKAAT